MRVQRLSLQPQDESGRDVVPAVLRPSRQMRSRKADVKTGDAEQPGTRLHCPVGYAVARRRRCQGLRNSVFRRPDGSAV